MLLLRGCVAALLLGFVPGWMLERAWFGATAPLAGLERLVLRVVTSMLLVGWIAFVLAECGIFSLWMLGGSVLLLCAGCALAARRHGWVLASAKRWSRSDWLLLLIGLGFALLVARPFEVIRGGLDAGVYVLTGFAIAHTGGIVQYDPLVADIGRRADQGDLDARRVRNQLFIGGNSSRFIATKQRVQGFQIITDDVARGRIVPQFFHLWPTWIAIFTVAGTPYTGLLATGVLATLGVLLLGLLGRRLVGPTVGVVAAAFLALSTPQVWFGRMPTSEALAQALTLAGLWSFTCFAAEPRGRHGRWWGWFTGVALGELALTRIDPFFVIGPVILLLLYIAFTRRWTTGYTALAATLGVLLLHTVLHTLVIARAYFFDTAFARLQDYALTAYASLPFLTKEIVQEYYDRKGSRLGHPLRLAEEIAVLLGAILLAAALRRRPALLGRVEAWVQHWQRPLLAAWVVGLGLMAAYAYLVRPHILTTALLRAPFTTENWLRLQGYTGAPIAVPPGYATSSVVGLAQANLVRIGWYLSPLGMVLAVWGAVRWWWRGLDRCSWLLLVTAALYTIFFVRLSYGTSEQTYIYILRRDVPVVFPGFMLAIAYGLFGSGWRPVVWRRMRPVAVGLALLLLIFFAWTGRSVYAHTEYAGSFPQFAALAEHLRPQDVLLVRVAHEDRDLSDIPAAPLTYLYDRNALTWKGTNAGSYGPAMAGQVTRWQAEGRAVYLLLGANSGELNLPGWGVQPVTDWSWRFAEYEQPRDHKPSAAAAPQTLTMRLYRIVPQAQAELPTHITPLDTAWQRNGMYRAELGEGEPVAWTGGSAEVELPHAVDDGQLVLDLASGPRPVALGSARVCTFVAPDRSSATDPAWQALGCQQVGHERQSLHWQVPPTLANQGWLIRIDTTPPWVPKDTQPDPGTPRSIDQRSLGVRFYAAARLP
ncbi:MAG: glycosyltransferase family 39 protein [Herpetosiphonaceae bacterium]|nr:glycosyltransferase family 39 protein [Herpetosiphonaceae bacterium]